MNIKYPYLPEGKMIKYVGMDNPFMLEARRMAKEKSTDQKHPTGAVIVKDGEIIGRGANQTPLKNKFLTNLHKSGWCVRKLFKIPSGKKYWMCPGCAQFSDHGERQALKDAIKNNKDTKGADLYLYGHWWCCQPCWDTMILSGINDVYLLEGSEKLFERDNSENILGTQFNS